MAGFNWSRVDWGSIAGAAASWYGSKKAGDAAKQAGQAQAAGSDASAALSRDVFEYQKKLNQPFYNSQLAALNEYNALMGLPQAGAQANQYYYDVGQDGTPVARADLYESDPAYRAAWDKMLKEHRKQWRTGYWSGSDRNMIHGGIAAMLGKQPGGPAKTPQQIQQEAFAKFRNQPGYQFGLTEGQRAIDASAASSGGLFSGKAGKELMKFGRNYSDQQGFTPYMNRLAAGAGIGQTNPVGNLQNAGGQYAAGAGQAMLDAAKARGSGLLGAANANYQGWSDAAGFLGKAYGNMGWGS